MVDSDGRGREDQWGALLASLQRGQCILLLGPGASIEPNGKLPLTTLLARHLKSLLSRPEEVVDDVDLAHVAQAYLRETGHRFELEQRAANFYASYDKRTNGVLSDLAVLPFKVCITTTHDSLFANALAEAALPKRPKRHFYSYQGHRELTAPQESERQPLLFQLCGSPEDGNSLVLTETDLLDFLVNVVRKEPPPPPYVTSLLADPLHSFLFVGFGLGQWHLRILLHVLGMHGHKYRSVALEDEAFFATSGSESTALFYQNSHYLDIRARSLPEFARDLKNRFQAGPPPKEAPVPLPEGSPKAFLCHYSGDAARVAELEFALHQRGVDTWRDRQQLRGGDDWARQIEHVIRRQVDYVLVLQTPSMRLQSTHSYFYQEISGWLAIVGWPRTFASSSPASSRRATSCTTTGWRISIGKISASRPVWTVWPR